MQVHLPAAAAPLSLRGEEEAPPGRAFPKGASAPGSEIQVRPLQEAEPSTAVQKEDSGDADLFQDLDPKTLAAILLQALQPAPKKSASEPLSPEPSPSEERVRSESRSSEERPAEEQEGWRAGKDQRPPQEEQENRGPEESDLGQQELETLQSMLNELQRYSPATKREAPAQAYQKKPQESPHDEVLQELEEYAQLKVSSKRKAPAASEPWAGARKLRQQQHLEHQLLQRRYEELAESRRQAEEARRAAAEEERLADMASDLLLQYLLKDGEEEEEDGQPGANAQEESEEEGPRGSPLLFEDEEGNVAEDKRSNEAPEEEEEDDDDIDPNTIDRLIELSSKLHLPADDVIDIINDVEKKKKEEVPELSGKSKTPAAPSRHKLKKAPPQAPRPLPKPYYPPAHQPYRHLPKQSEASWNEVLEGSEYPAPKWYRAKPGHSPSKISNYISPRTFQAPVYHHLRHLPGPMVPRGESYDAGQEHDEELENYIESVLMKHPKAFQ
ncbi:Neurosecretory protein VGF [Varanus komodoensis]|nr:Neurosecretory protein VGF [Varanus komodoensis]